MKRSQVHSKNWLCFKAKRTWSWCCTTHPKSLTKKLYNSNPQNLPKKGLWYKKCSRPRNPSSSLQRSPSRKALTQLTRPNKKKLLKLRRYNHWKNKLSNRSLNMSTLTMRSPLKRKMSSNLRTNQKTKMIWLCVLRDVVENLIGKLYKSMPKLAKLCLCLRERSLILRLKD